MSQSRTRPTGAAIVPDGPRTPYRVADPVVALWGAAQRLRPRMDSAYNRVDALLRECPNDDESISKAHGKAETLGQEYTDLCERICNTEAHTFKGVLAKLRCAARCIRDTVPPTNDPKLTCDIELRLVFSLERDLEKLLAN
jgi:hypothetical protein